jgi:oxygen-independent coproporphyrinogen-3 oxidase
LRSLSEKHGAEAALQMFLQDFDVSPEKVRLAQEICNTQLFASESVKPESLDIYIGIPYCRSRCLYCSFGSEVSKRPGELDEYLKYLLEDIRKGSEIAAEGNYALRSIYIGGGTPTVFSERQLEILLDAIMANYDIRGLEFTVEAGRPDTITPEKLRILKAAGVTRISINPQTMNNETLRRIGRAHLAEDILSAFYEARNLGFDNINMDLIAGLPGEKLADMERSLSEIFRLAPESLTIHTLAIKRSSRLKAQLEITALPDEDTVRNMLSAADREARKLCLFPYYLYRQKYMSGSLENVGYSLSGRECVYNIDMMEECCSVLSHGAGSMSKRIFPGRNQRVERIASPKDVGTYFGKIEDIYSLKRKLFLP